MGHFTFTLLFLAPTQKENWRQIAVICIIWAEIATWVCPEKGTMGEYWERDSPKSSYHRHYSLILEKSRSVLRVSRQTHISCVSAESAAMASFLHCRYSHWRSSEIAIRSLVMCQPCVFRSKSGFSLSRIMSLKFTEALFLSSTHSHPLTHETLCRTNLLSLHLMLTVSMRWLHTRQARTKLASLAPRMAQSNWDSYQLKVHRMAGGHVSKKTLVQDSLCS